MCARVSRFLIWVLALGSLALMPAALSAQDSAKPAVKTASDDSGSKWDIFFGYSYLAPHGTVGSVQATSDNYGSDYSVARYFTKYVGAQVEATEHITNENQYAPNGTSSGPTWSNVDFAGGGAGLIFRFPTADITPFIHGLVGVEHSDFQSGTSSGSAWGPGLTAGGGMDYNTPFFDHHLAIRIFQADFKYAHENYSGSVGRANFNMAQLSAGFVYRIGNLTPPPPVTLACSVSPTSVFPGDPVTATATAGSLNPKQNVIYSWSGTGVTGNGATAMVGTTALSAGSYTVKGTVKEGKPGKEGLKPGESADCSASFTVKEYEPPTITCAANPSTIKPGETSNITCAAMSPQNRPLTYSYAASAGTVTGNGTTALFSSTGAPTGAVEITGSVSDDKGHTVPATTSVTITAPYVAPIPHSQALCSITFDKDKKRPTRVDNEAKACLDEVALDLQRQSDAKAVVVGESDAAEKANQAKEEATEKKRKHPKPVVDDAAQRAVNAKEYLVTEKGIDASRISAATGTTDGQTVEDYLVPAGATFTSDVNGTTPVDETAVKPEVRKPLPERHPGETAAAGTGASKSSTRPPQ
jgi:hypothetical protein